MLNPEYEDIPYVHQSVERYFGQVGDRIKEVLQPLGSRRFWIKFVEPQMIGACIIPYGLIRFMLPLAELMKGQTTVPNFISTAEGVGIMALGTIIFYKYTFHNGPKWDWRVW